MFADRSDSLGRSTGHIEEDALHSPRLHLRRRRDGPERWPCEPKVGYLAVVHGVEDLLVQEARVLAVLVDVGVVFFREGEGVAVARASHDHVAVEGRPIFEDGGVLFEIRSRAAAWHIL